MIFKNKLFLKNISMELLNYNVLNILKSYLPNRTFNRISATCNKLCYIPITRTEMRRRRCYVYLNNITCYKHIECVKYKNVILTNIRVTWFRNENIDVLKYIIKHLNLSIKELDNQGSRHLILANACCYDDILIFKYITGLGLTLKDLRTSGNYYLRCCAECGSMKIMKYLIKLGMTITDIRGEHNNVLKYAAKNEHFEMVKYLVEQGLNIQDIGVIHDPEMYNMAKNIINNR